LCGTGVPARVRHCFGFAAEKPRVIADPKPESQDTEPAGKKRFRVARKLYANWNVPRDYGPSPLNFTDRFLPHQLPPQLQRPTETNLQNRQRFQASRIWVGGPLPRGALYI
jgi:hypothetical protein